MKRTIAGIELKNVLLEQNGLISPVYQMKDAKGEAIGGVTSTSQIEWPAEVREQAKKLLDSIGSVLAEMYLTEK